MAHVDDSRQIGELPVQSGVLLVVKQRLVRSRKRQVLHHDLHAKLPSDVEHGPYIFPAHGLGPETLLLGHALLGVVKYDVPHPIFCGQAADPPVTVHHVVVVRRAPWACRLHADVGTMEGQGAGQGGQQPVQPFPVILIVGESDQLHPQPVPSLSVHPAGDLLHLAEPFDQGTYKYFHFISPLRTIPPDTRWTWWSRRRRNAASPAECSSTRPRPWRTRPPA